MPIIKQCKFSEKMSYGKFKITINEHIRAVLTNKIWCWNPYQLTRIFQCGFWLADRRSAT